MRWQRAQAAQWAVLQIHLKKAKAWDLAGWTNDRRVRVLVGIDTSGAHHWRSWGSLSWEVVDRCPRYAEVRW